MRQGDILFVRSEVKPTGEVKRHAQLTVALGEATGHHHTLYPLTSRMLANELADAAPANFIEEFLQGNKRFVRLDTAWLLRHQEHHELRIEPGTYEIITEREYDPFGEAMKKVVD